MRESDLDHAEEAMTSAISGRLRRAIAPAAEQAGRHALEAVDVRLRPDRIPVPDLVVTTDIDFDQLVIDAEVVRLVCELISPSNAATDKVLKLHFYAAAGTPWYLLVEQSTGALNLYQLAGDIHVEHSVATAGRPLRSTDPPAVTIDPAELLPPR